MARLTDAIRNVVGNAQPIIESTTIVDEQQIDEISREKAAGYVKNSVRDLGASKYVEGAADSEKHNHGDWSDRRNFDKNVKPSMKNRSKGIETALNKLSGKAKVNATEEVEVIDELSKGKVASYVMHAAKDEAAARKEVSHLGKTLNPDKDDYEPLGKAEDRVMKRKQGQQTAAAKFFGKAKVNATEEVDTTETEETAMDESVGLDTLHAASRTFDDPKSRVEVLANIVNAVNTLKPEDMTQWYEKAMALIGHEADKVGDKSDSNKSTISAKPSHAQGSGGPSAKDAMPKLNVKEDIEAIFVGDELSEEFKTRASTLFEAAIITHNITETARLEDLFEASLVEAIETINEELSTKVEDYLNYVAEQWLEENKVAIESSLRNELAQDLLDGIKNVFEEHYVSLPEEKVDVVEALASKVDDLNIRFNKIFEENKQLKGALIESQRQDVVESYLDTIPMSQHDKFIALAEGIDFNGDLKAYSVKLNTIKEAHFTTEKKTTTTSNIMEETFEGDTSSQSTVNIDASVNRYVQAISKTIKK